MTEMTRFIPICLTLCCAALPAQSDEESGLSLMERGAQMFMEGILREVEPALEGLEEVGPALRSFAEQMGPALGDLLSEVEDWSRYHPPEILENGDITLRRKRPEDAPQEAPSGQDTPPSEPIDI